MDERGRQVLEIARVGHNPGPADAARVRAALKARVLAEPALLQASARAPLEASLLRKLLLAFAAGSAVGLAAGLYIAQALAPRAAANVGEAPATVAPVAVAAATAGDSAGEGEAALPTEVTPAHAPAVDESSAAPSDAQASADARRKLPEPSGPAAHSVKTSARTGPGPLKAELDGLRRAQELLHQSEPAWALARLDELDRAQVGSVLLEERAATRAIAECLLGRDPGAQSREFERRFPRSAHLEQVRSSCSAAHQSGTPQPNVLPAQTESSASRHE